jgi:DnaJ homolog subfamily A member 5
MDCFSIKNKFSWEDAYKCGEAYDRQTRRFVEKKNRRLRDDGVREFNDAVKSVVRFVRRRDLRYRGNFQSEDRRKILRDAAAAQAVRSRAANQAKIGPQAMPALAQVADVEEEILFSEQELSDKDLYECIACKKIFKSENQYEAHERNKKHINAIRDLRRME